MKGASFIDMMVGFVLLFIIAIAIMVGTYMYNQIDYINVFNTSTTAQEGFQHAGTTMNIMGEVFLVFVLAVGIGAVVSAFYIASNPAFFVIMIPVNAILIILTAVFSNAFESLITLMPAEATTHYLMILVMRNFPIVCIVLAFVVAAVAYSKTPYKTAGGGRLM